ncbi:hypothetical protein EVA_03277 [gut metagenome]|uniref:Uncharacterized protein n=1 Tax=gut metagenome TaxID=749906 RepID=J9GM88_9ZZZZ
MVGEHLNIFARIIYCVVSHSRNAPTAIGIVATRCANDIINMRSIDKVVGQGNWELRISPTPLRVIESTIITILSLRDAFPLTVLRRSLRSIHLHQNIPLEEVGRSIALLYNRDFLLSSVIQIEYQGSRTRSSLIMIVALDFPTSRLAFVNREPRHFALRPFWRYSVTRIREYREYRKSALVAYVNFTARHQQGWRLLSLRQGRLLIFLSTYCQRQGRYQQCS